MLTQTGESGGGGADNSNRFGLYGGLHHPQHRGGVSAMAPPPMMTSWQHHQHVDMSGGTAWPEPMNHGHAHGQHSDDDDDVGSDEDGGGILMSAASGSAGGGKKTKKTSGTAGGKKDVFICAEVHCGKQFPRSFALRRHMRIHTGNKPYVCDHDGCSQRFNTSGNLSRHKRIHSGERPYPCIFATCGKRFNTSTKLKRHMRIHFPEGQNLFRCIGVNCSWSCDNYKEFAQHQKLHHNIIVGAAQSQHHPSHQQQAQQVAPVAQTVSVSASHHHHQQENDSSLRNSSVAPANHHHHQSIKSDPDFFLTDHHSRHEYDGMQTHHTQSHHTSTNTGSFLFKQTVPPPPPSSVGPPRKIMGQFFGSDMGGLPVLQKDQKQKGHADIDHGYPDSRRGTSSTTGKSAIAGHSAFPLSEQQHSSVPQYHHSRSSSYEVSTFSLNAESSYARPGGSSSAYGNHYAHMRSGNSSDGNEDYEQQHHHQQQPHHGHHQQQHHHSGSRPPHHVLRPPPQGDDNMKFGGFSVPPPMNPAAPEFTGEELSVVLELMKDSYC